MIIITGLERSEFTIFQALRDDSKNGCVVDYSEVSGITRLLRAHDCNYRESLDRLKKSKIRTIFQENPLGDMFKKCIPRFGKANVSEKTGKNENSGF